MPTAHVNGVDLHYELAGHGEPVALLNGILMSTLSWAPVATLVARHHRVLLHDFRGQLGSGKPEQPWPFSRHAEDLAALLDHLHLGPCHLVGTSYGGEVAVLLAAQAPQRVRSLTVVASAAHLDPTLALKVQAWASAAQTGPALLARAVAADSYCDRFLTANPGLVELTARRLEALPPAFLDGFGHLVAAFMDLDLRPHLPRIACPTLVVAAEEDRLKPVSASRTVAAAIPGARLVTVAGAGHAVVVEQPQLVAALALGFMATLPPVG